VFELLGRRLLCAFPPNELLSHNDADYNPPAVQRRSWGTLASANAQASKGVASTSMMTVARMIRLISLNSPRRLSWHSEYTFALRHIGRLRLGGTGGCPEKRFDFMGCMGAAIYTAISSGPGGNSQSPEQGGGCLPPIRPAEKPVLHDQQTDLSSDGYAAAVWVIDANEVWPRGSYTSPPIRSRCSKTASFRATATVARFFAFFPPRAHNFFPNRRKSVSGPNGWHCPPAVCATSGRPPC